MSLRTSDYEERVFHELREAGGEVTIQKIAERTHVKDATVRRIVSVFEDMEFVRRVPLFPEGAFIFDPSPVGVRLKKYRDLTTRTDLMKRMRLSDSEAHAAYARSR